MVQDKLRWREVPECSGLFSSHASHCPEMDRWESQEADWLWGQRSLQISGAGNNPDLAFTASGTLDYLLQLDKEIWLEGPVLGGGVRKVAYVR